MKKEKVGAAHGVLTFAASAPGINPAVFQRSMERDEIGAGASSPA